MNIQSAVDKRMYEAAFRNTETVQYEFQANSNSLRRALSVMNAGAQKVDTVKVSFEGQMMSISDMKNDNFVSAIDVKTTAEKQRKKSRLYRKNWMRSFRMTFLVNLRICLIVKMSI